MIIQQQVFHFSMTSWGPGELANPLTGRETESGGKISEQAVIDFSLGLVGDPEGSEEALGTTDRQVCVVDAAAHDLGHQRVAVTFICSSHYLYICPRRQSGCREETVEFKLRHPDD